MPTETPSTVAQIYGLLLLLSGFACVIHFVFFFDKPKKIAPERGVPGWRLTFPDFLIGFLGIVAAVVLAQVFLTHLLPAEWLDPEVPMHIVAFGSGIHVAALATLFVFYKSQPKKFREPLNRAKLSWFQSFKIAGYAFLVVAPVLYSLAYGWQYLLENLGMDLEPQQAVAVFAQVDNLPVMLLLMVLTVLIAPVSEELLFRGCLYRFIKTRLSLIFALLLSGVLFGLLHANLSGFLPLSLLGVALAYTYERSGNIKVPILFHSIFNLNTVIIIVLTLKVT